MFDRAQLLLTRVDDCWALFISARVLVKTKVSTGFAYANIFCFMGKNVLLIIFLTLFSKFYGLNKWMDLYLL